MYYDKELEVRASALKHGVAAEDSLIAAKHPLLIMELDDLSSGRELRLGFDAHGRLLELLIATTIEGRKYLIHAMKARKIYVDLLTKG